MLLSNIIVKKVAVANLNKEKQQPFLITDGADYYAVFSVVAAAESADDVQLLSVEAEQ